MLLRNEAELGRKTRGQGFKFPKSSQTGGGGRETINSTAPYLTRNVIVCCEKQLLFE
jgi:hypothetical protein